MSWKFSERHIHEFNEAGFTILRGILPPTLITDLRRQCERGRDQVRQRDGAQAQRFQPVQAFDVDLKPFQDYRELPELRDAYDRILGPGFEHGGADMLGVLLEPQQLPWCTAWHRDWRDNIPGLDIAAWEKVQHDREMFNQVNAPLYEDSCTWAVPGSHSRSDTPEEAALFPHRPTRGPKLDGLSAEQRERTCLEYCAAMPHAERFLMDAGDLALYRSTLWHLGNYIPYRRRATLHDTPMTPRFLAWTQHARQGAEQRLAGASAA